jgi:hypothetical protein
MASPDAANLRTVSRIQNDVNRLGVQALKEYAVPNMAASLGYAFFCWVQQIPGGLIGRLAKIPSSHDTPGCKPNVSNGIAYLSDIKTPYRLPSKYLFTYLSEIRIAAGPRSYRLSYSANRACMYNCLARDGEESVDRLTLTSRWDFMVANSHTIFSHEEVRTFDCHKYLPVTKQKHA